MAVTERVVITKTGQMPMVWGCPPMFDGYHVYVRLNDFSVFEPVRVFKTVQDVLDYAGSVRRQLSSVDTIGVWWYGPNNTRVGYDDVFEWGYSRA